MCMADANHPARHDPRLEEAVVDIALGVPPHDVVVAILTGIRLEADVRSVAEDLARASTRRGRRGRFDPVAFGAGRLVAAAELHRLLTDMGEEVDLSDHVVAVCSAIALCGGQATSVRIDLQASRRRVDGSTARWAGLVLAALLCGPATAAPVPVDGPVAVSVSCGFCFLEIEVVDGGADPPDRIAVGGPLLERIVEVTRSAVAPCSGHGRSLLRMPFPGLAAMECAGSA